MLEVDSSTIDLDNASVAAVSREASSVSIHIERASLKRAGASSVVDVTLIVEGVSSELATLHLAHGATQTLALDATPPLDLVEVWELRGGTLELEGYRRSEPWVTWIIQGNTVSAQIRSNRVAGSI